MATEIKNSTTPFWRAGLRLPVLLTFEHQSGEGAPLLPDDRSNYMVGGAMQYGARRGIWNVLEMLGQLGVKATFLVCGGTSEKYPDAVRTHAFRTTLSKQRRRTQKRRTGKLRRSAMPRYNSLFFALDALVQCVWVKPAPAISPREDRSAITIKPVVI